MIRRSVLISLPLLAVATLVFAQSTPGRFSGSVAAPDGSYLPGAAITITNLDTRDAVTVPTGSRGAYHGPNLPPGRYELTAELDGFRPQQVAEVVLSAAEARQIDFTLAIASYQESVTVVGTASRDTVEAAAIRESSARDVGEVLAEISGTAMVRKGGIANDVVLHGYQGENLTVLIDGARIYGACPNNMDPRAFHVDFAEVDRVEVGKGPYDMKNQGSLGGIINVVTRRPQQGFHTTSNASAASYSFVNPSVTASLGNGAIAGLGGYSYRSANAYRDGSGHLFTEYANYRLADPNASAFEVKTGWGRAFVSPSEGHSLQVAYTRQDATGVLYPYLQMDAVYDDGDRATATYEHAGPLGPVQTLSARAYYSRVSHWMTDQQRTTANNMPRGYSMGTDAHTGTFGGKVEAGGGGLVAGMEAFRRDWDATTNLAKDKYQPQYSIPFVVVDEVGAYAEYTRPLSGRVTLDLGGRLDRTASTPDQSKVNDSVFQAYHGVDATAKTDTYPSARANLTYRVAEAVTLSGGVGRTVRVPDPRERYFQLKRMGTDWVGNPELDPSRNTGVNVAVSYRHRRFQVNSTLYRDSVQDYVTPVRQVRIQTASGVMNALARSYENVAATLTGGDIDFSGSLTGALLFSGSAAFTRGSKTPDPQRGITSPYLAEMPPVMGRAALRYDKARVFGEVEAVVAASQDRVDSDLLEQPTPGYTVFNLRVGGKVKMLRLSFALDNVLDRQYTNHLSYQRDPFRSGVRVPEPGRSVYMNVSWAY